MILRSAESILRELILIVQPPRGCEIRVTERISSGAFEPNWGSTCGNLEPLKLALYDQKVADLRKAHPKIDWSDVKAVANWRGVPLAVGIRTGGGGRPDGAKRRPGRQVASHAVVINQRCRRIKLRY